MFKVIVIGEFFPDITDMILGVIRDLGKGYEKKTSIFIIRPETISKPSKDPSAPLIIVCGSGREEDINDIARTLKKGMGIEVYFSPLKIPY